MVKDKGLVCTSQSYPKSAMYVRECNYISTLSPKVKGSVWSHSGWTKSLLPSWL